MCADLSLIFCNIACSPSYWLLAFHSTTDDTNATTREIDINININIDINNNNYYNNCHKESESSATVDSSVYHSYGGHYHYHFQYHCNQQSLLKYELPTSSMISDSQNPKISFGTARTYDTTNDTENEYLLPPQASTLPKAAAALSPCVRNVQKILGPRPYYLDSYLETTDSQRKREERKWRDLRRQRQKRRWKRLLGVLVRSIAPWKSSSSSSSSSSGGSSYRSSLHRGQTADRSMSHRAMQVE
mmetsp:Transcript_9182/g.27337  ORF Transcript_9182/g.27337 Transcript_9182/m.27337 type:complete len:245 (+) Transcript_9182:215-949(+)